MLLKREPVGGKALVFLLRHYAALIVDDFRVERQLFLGAASFHVRPEVNARPLLRGFRCRHLCAPDGDVYGLRLQQMDVAVESGTGVPPR